MKQSDIEDFLKNVDVTLHSKIRRLLEIEKEVWEEMTGRKAKREILEDGIFDDLRIEHGCLHGIGKPSEKNQTTDDLTLVLKRMGCEERPDVKSEIVAHLPPTIWRDVYAQMFKAAPEMMRLLLQIKDEDEQTGGGGGPEYWFESFPERINKLLVSVFTDEAGAWYRNVDESMMPKHLRNPDYIEEGIRMGRRVKSTIEYFGLGYIEEEE